MIDVFQDRHHVVECYRSEKRNVCLSILYFYDQMDETYSNFLMYKKASYQETLKWYFTYTAVTKIEISMIAIEAPKNM